MRRSCAPSMRKSVKRKSTDNIENEITTTTESADDQQDYGWGTKNQTKRSYSLSNDAAGNENSFYNNILANKRIFNIVWRDVTTKKHKTWKGDGTLEVDVKQARAVLKDDTGKYMGCTSKLNINELEEDCEMIVGGKEIQLLDEIKSVEAYAQLRKQQIDNRGWGDEEWQPKDETKKPKGAFIFKCSLVLDRPQVAYKRIVHKEESATCEAAFENADSTRPATILSTEYICLLRPSELQSLLLKKAKKIFTKHQVLLQESNSNEDILSVLQNICDHPSLISNSIAENILASNLERHLPEWTEMGPFDSSKLEFVQYFLTTTASEKEEKCLIVASDSNCLNMLNGLCDFLNLKYCRINNDSTSQEILEAINAYRAQNKTLILLLHAKANFENALIGEFKNLIYFDDGATAMKLSSLLRTNVHANGVSVYHLITSGCYEEKRFLKGLNETNKTDCTNEELCNLMELEDEPKILGLHDTLGCKCLCDGSNTDDVMEKTVPVGDLIKWKHLRPPFDETLLRETKLENVGENLIFLFSRQFYI